MLVAVAAGAGLGLINGAIVTRLRIQSFLATLATQFVIVGVAIYLTDSTNSFRVTDFLGFQQFANGELLGIQYKAWIAAGRLRRDLGAAARHPVRQAGLRGRRQRRPRPGSPGSGCG